MSIRLYLLQRITAAILAILVVVHLALIVIAVQGGLTAGEILARTRGSAGWAAFYGFFVVTAALHGSIGLRTVLAEWGRLGRGAANGAALVSALLLLAVGLRAVWAVT